MTTADVPYDWDAALKLVDQRRKLFDALIAENRSYHIGHWDHKEVKEVINAYPDDLIRRIDAFISAAENESDSERIVDAIRLFIVDEDTRERIKEVIHFLPLFPTQVTEFTAKKMITALNHYQQLPRSNDYSSEDHVLVSQCNSLLHVTCGLLHIFNIEDTEMTRDMIFNEDSTILDEKLVELALTHPEQGEFIRDCIIQREYVDAQLIEEMLTTDAHALNGGVL